MKVFRNRKQLPNEQSIKLSQTGSHPAIPVIMRLYSVLRGLQQLPSVQIKITLIGLHLLALLFLIQTNSKNLPARSLIYPLLPNIWMPTCPDLEFNQLRPNHTRIKGAKKYHRRNESQPLGNPLYLHYVKFREPSETNITISFLDYLSVQSAVQRLRPDIIFLHSDVEPIGYYWEEMTRRNWITHKPRKPINKLTGRIHEVALPEHTLDLAKLDILMEYGGVSADFDVYFVRGERLKAQLTNHTAYACYVDDITYSNGLMAFSSASRLLRALRRSYDIIYQRQSNFQNGDVLKYLSEVFAEEVYVVNHVCNNPHVEDDLDAFFNGTTSIEWMNSVAIQTHRANLTSSIISGPEDFVGEIHSYKELLLSIYENHLLPPADANFNDSVNPRNGTRFL